MISSISESILSISVWVALEIGLSRSAVLSTLPRPTCSAVTWWGLLKSLIWLSRPPSLEVIRSSSSFLVLSTNSWVALETGLSRSDVLSTFPSPTCSLVTWWGLLRSATWVLTLSVVSFPLSPGYAVELVSPRAKEAEISIYREPDHL